MAIQALRGGESGRLIFLKSTDGDPPDPKRFRVFFCPNEKKRRQVVSSRRARWVGVFLVLVNCLGISGKSVFIPLLYRAGLSGSEIVAGRLLYAIPAFWLILLVAGGKRDRRLPGRAEGWAIAGLAALSAVPIVAHTEAYALISPALASTLVYIFPLFVVALEWILFGQKPDRRLWVVIPAVYAGILLVLGGGGEPLAAGGWKGVALTLAAALAFSVYLVLQPRAYAPKGPLVLSPVGYCAWASIVLPVVAGPFLYHEIHGYSFLADPKTAGLFLGFGFLSTALPFVSLMVAVRLLGAVWTAVLSMLTPALSVILTALVLDDTLDPWQYGGVGLMILGLAVLQILKKKPEAGRLRVKRPGRFSPEGIHPEEKGKAVRVSGR
jgi:drug/metabolite transporter (DMT)-like permease